MLRWSKAAGFVLWVTLLGSLTVPESQGAEPSPVEVRKTIKAKKLDKLLVGSWQIHLPEGLQRDISVIRLALRPDSTPEELAALNPTDEERMVYADLRAKVEADPDDPDLAQPREMLSIVSQLTMVITKRNMSATYAGNVEINAYEVIERRDNELMVLMQTGEIEKPATLVFVDRATIVFLETGKEPFKMTRLD